MSAKYETGVLYKNFKRSLVVKISQNQVTNKPFYKKIILSQLTKILRFYLFSHRDDTVRTEIVSYKRI